MGPGGNRPATKSPVNRYRQYVNGHQPTGLSRS